MSDTFRLGYVPGATPGKWARVWRERLDVPLDLVQVDAADAVAALDRGDVDAAIARLPVDKTRLSAILLYEELPVVVVSRDHLLAATEEDEVVTAADIADDVVHLAADDVLYGAGPGSESPGSGGPVPGLRPVAYREDGSIDVSGTPERPPTTAEAIAWVAAGAGVTIVPLSLARLHHRKDVAYRVLDGGPTAPVGLVWVSERTTDLVDEMVGIVRGRTVNSSRGRAAPQPAAPATTAKQARAQQTRAGANRKPASGSAKQPRKPQRGAGAGGKGAGGKGARGRGGTGRRPR